MVHKFQVFNTRKIGSKIDYTDDAHREFRHWVESQLVLHVTVANRNALPVEVRIMRDGRTIDGESLSLNPNYERAFALHVGDRIFAFDERLDTFPGAIRNDEINANTKGVGTALGYHRYTSS